MPLRTSRTAPWPHDQGVVTIIPAHEEATRIGTVVRSAVEHLPVLVVDDGSSDETAERATEAGATVVRQLPNKGKGAALRTGFAWAIDHGFEAAVTLDGDGQHDPVEIPRFLEAWAAGAPDLVVGRRNFRTMPPMRRVANVLGTVAFSWAVGRRIPDNQSGFRLVSRRLMEATLGSDEAGFEFEVEMIVTAIRAGWTIAWVPIRTIYAGETSHIRPASHLTKFLATARRARRTVRTPLP
jgi:glycosyltransferase involved in cell wall biosynthesis